MILAVALAAALGGASGQESAPLPAGYTALLETPDPQYDVRLTVTPPAPLELVFAADAERGYRLRLSPREAVLERFAGGRSVRLASAAAPPPGTAPRELTFRRREFNLYVLIDGRIVLDALDSSHAAGRVGIAAGAPVAPAAEPYQPVEDIFFSDDFMRTEQQQQLGVWRHSGGAWRFYSVTETNPRASVQLSVNPFSLGLRNDQGTPAAVLAGYPFWCDYDASVSVRSRGAWAGLIVAARGPGDWYLLRADLRERALRPRRIELVRAVGGTETVLAGGSALLSADQWYRLGVRLRGPRLQCFLDDGLIFDWLDPAAAGGSIGLWSNGPHESLFDDVRCVTNLSWRLDRGATLKRYGQATGEWQFGGVSDEPAVGAPTPRHLISPAEGRAVYALGDPAGAAFRLDTSVRFQRAGTVGLVFAHTGDEYHAAVWDGLTSSLRLTRVAAGRETVLTTVTDAMTPGREHSLALDLTQPGRVLVRRDGQLRLRAELPDLPAGRLGLLTDGLAARFEGTELRLFVARDTEVEVDNANFAADPFMLNWASSLADWMPVGEPKNDAMGQQVYWHKGDFYRAYELDLPAAGSLALALNAGTPTWLPAGDQLAARAVRIDPVDGKQHPGDGYSLHLIGAGGADGSVHLFRDGKAVAEGVLPEGIERLTVGRDGGVTWVEAGNRDVLVYHDPDPPQGPLVAIRVPNQDVLLNTHCHRDGVIDEIFERAPADWIQQGDWEITNRFSCTPTWSHMAALERGGLGGLWHKDAFPGDVTVEYYAGMRMQVPAPNSGWVGYYPRPGDFNCTIAARPFDLASGFSVLPGAWDADWSSTLSRLAHGVTTLAETNRPLVPRTREDQGQRYIPVPYIRAGRDVHGAWYYVKQRLAGGKLSALFDGVPILEADAPSPQGDRVAVWTQDNEIMVARVRITYQQKRIPAKLVAAPPAEPLADSGAPVQLHCAEAPGYGATFTESLEGWGPRDAVRQVLVEHAQRNGDGYLRAENLLPGGSFEVAAPLAQIAFRAAALFSNVALADAVPRPDVTRAALLRFDYALAPSTRINLYLTLNGQRHSIPLTGPAEDAPLLPVLYRPDGIVADGTWRTCTVPLGAALRRAFGQAQVTLGDVRFGVLHEGYLLAGFGGNPVGAWYAVDNLAIVPEVAPGTPLNLVVKPLGAAGREVATTGVRALWSATPSGPMPEVEPLTGPLAAPAEPGLHWLAARADLELGQSMPVRRPVLVAAGEPRLEPVGANADWDGGPVRLAFGPSAPLDATVTIGDKVLPWSDAVTVDAEAGQLVLDPRAAGATWADGQTVALTAKVAFASGATRELTVERTYRLRADRRPPTAPLVSGLGYQLDFEDGRTVLRGSGGTVVRNVSRADGGRAARVVNGYLGGSFVADLLQSGVDVGRQPVLMFDYQVREPVRFDILAGLGRGTLALPFFDSSGSYPTLCPVPDGQRDGQWHRASVNLQSAMAARLPFEPTMYRLGSLTTGDYGYSGAAPGASFEVDNVRLVRVVPGDGQAKVGWSAYDAGGIAGWRVGWGPDETVAPTADLPAAQSELAIVPASEGLYWFAIQARDAAGNLGPVTRQVVLIDRAAPAFGAPDPPPGPLGRWDLSVPIGGLGPATIDPASLRLSVGEETAPVEPGLVRFEPQRGSLSWDWAIGRAAFAGPVADGTPVSMRLEGADTAGQPAPPADWEYTVAYAADQQPPLAPEVTIAEQPTALLIDFGRSTGALGPAGGSYVSPGHVVVDGETNDRCYQLTTTGTGRYLQAASVDLVKFPYLSVDYKLPDSVQLHLQLYLNGSYYTVSLNGTSASYPAIAVQPIAADGKWHTLVVDLLALAKAQLPNATAFDMRYLALNERGSNGGHRYWIDNIALFGPSPRVFKVTWQAFDATGIAVGASSLSADLSAAPPTEPVTDQRDLSLTAPQAGVYLLQLRARDGAGNWSGSARRVIVTP